MRRKPIYNYFVSYFIWYPTHWSFGWSNLTIDTLILNKDDLLLVTDKIQKANEQETHEFCAKVTILNFILLPNDPDGPAIKA